MSQIHLLRIDATQDGDRLDRALAALLPDISRATLQKHIEAGAVTLDGEAPPRGGKTKVRGGQEVRYTPPPPEPLDLVPENIPLSVLYEDEHFLAVDKPAGLVVHPGPGHPRGTLVNAVLHYLGRTATEEDGLRPGIVHRLDQGTTGVIVVAKDVRAHERLGALFRDRAVEKRYLAVVRGVPRVARERIETRYGRHPRERQRFSSRVKEGKVAISEVETRRTFPGAALVEVRLLTGRTHQIRVHLADRGHALLGDAMYGGRGRIADAELAAVVERLERPALHAWRLAFDHPFSGARISLEAPIPADFAELLDALDALAARRR